MFTAQREDHFSRTLGIHNLRAHFNKLERDLKKGLGAGSENVGENSAALRDLEGDAIFEGVIVQRSRAYALRKPKNEYGSWPPFPIARNHKLYSIFKTYGALLDLIERAFMQIVSVI